MSEKKCFNSLDELMSGCSTSLLKDHVRIIEIEAP